ncbi:YkoF family thiamine/hydroxymethylpyrimidine-binding protein [Agaribacter flavus]|uniref:YkoF family thiamine/hydroxymethylpyrimidine-binding protein n=1 Tax=Agaribacter flavus TaxID=1902781 RepID=A0ABV7FKR1_9ALTE
MKLAVEITLYPLDNAYIGFIQDFIARLNEEPDLYVNTTHTCTLVSGDYDQVMHVLHREFKTTYQQVGQAAFVCKFLNADNMDIS